MFPSIHIYILYRLFYKYLFVNTHRFLCGLSVTLNSFFNVPITLEPKKKATHINNVIQWNRHIINHSSPFLLFVLYYFKTIDCSSQRLDQFLQCSIFLNLHIDKRFKRNKRNIHVCMKLHKYSFTDNNSIASLLLLNNHPNSKFCTYILRMHA
jgi:hypothetical protein